MDPVRLAKTREGYDRIASEYATRIGGELAHKPFDRAILARFADRVRAAGPVLDLGCGPGHVSQYLHDLGVAVTGIDLSPAMIEIARQQHPAVPFESGSMLDIPANGGLAGIVAMYAVIHIDRAAQPAMFARWFSALQLGGSLLISFHIGNTDRHIEDMWGTPVDIDFLFFTRDEIEHRLIDAGFTIVESHERAPYAGVEVETQRCYILATR